MPTFTALLRRSDNVGSTTFLAVPPDVMATFAPKRRVPVVVTIAGRSYRSTIACYGEDFLIPVRAEIREAAGLAPGDVIDVAIERDDALRDVVVPEDLAAALEANGLRAAFDAMAFSHRNEYVRWIDDAKKPATRRTRITGTIERVAAKRASP